MNPALLLALIQNVGVPELTDWLRRKHQAGEMILEADVDALLKLHTGGGIATGEAWLAAHPETPDQP